LSNDEVEIMKKYEWIVDLLMVTMLVIFVANLIRGAI
jgi:hypothetical protein